MIKLLFVINSMNIGGPQKSLLALLDALDYNTFSADILVLNPGGQLEAYLNKNARLLRADSLLTAITLQRGHTTSSLKTMLYRGKLPLLAGALSVLFTHKIRKTNMNQLRQHLFWRYHDTLPRITDQYDAAFGILGLSTYVVRDLVDAKQKYHWIRSDTRILNRNESIDAAYYRDLTGALSVSQECADIFVDLYPFMKGRVKVFHNLIPLDYYNSLPKEKEPRFVPGKEATLLTITRLDPLKGIELAIEACRLMKSRGRDVKWYVLGDGPHRKAVEKLIAQAGVVDRFILLGFKLNIPHYLIAADIVVHASYSEGKSNAVDEALMLKKPLVVTDYPTVHDQVTDGVNGLICPMTGEGISLAVSRLLDDSYLRARLTQGESAEQTEPNAFFIDLLLTMKGI